MKFKSLIWISGIALLILIFVQFYFITETFHTKEKQYDNKYIGVSKLALFEFENKYFDIELDSILTLLDDYSYFAMHDFGFASDTIMQDSVKWEIYQVFDEKLNSCATKSLYLKEYFINAGIDSIFDTKYIIHEISLLPFNEEVTVYENQHVDEEFPSTGYNVNNYIVERNYFRIRYDYHIIFTGRPDQIAREMLLTKTLSVITLLIVFAVFFLTLRNLFIQKRMSELKTDFINNMTHELKTPLSTISVASSTLAGFKGKLDSDRIVEISGIIKKQNRHLTKLIDRILDISIWEKDQVKIKKKPVTVVPFIKEIAENFSSMYPEATIIQNSNGIDEEKTVALDEVHMNTVFNNLLSNALKYGGNPPSVEINIGVNEKLLVSIRDNGKGISSEEQSQIFDKFFRGKETRRQAIRGLGLGLYYVKQIVEAHGGMIKVSSANDEGSEFTIEIPE